MFLELLGVEPSWEGDVPFRCRQGDGCRFHRGRRCSGTALAGSHVACGLEGREKRRFTLVKITDLRLAGSSVF